MTDVLVLGGTGWLSGRVAEMWLERGASVTCLARGGRPAPAGAELVVADRDGGVAAYADVAGRTWDEVVDVSSIPEHVGAAVASLADRAAHWTYVSSLSVYASDDVVGADESAPVHEPAAAGEVYDYGRAKSAAESSVRSALADRASILRAGLIVGPDDPTDRFGYWVSRFALAGDEPVLVPAVDDRRCQVIDVDDLAAFVVAGGGGRGTFNATGRSLSLGEVLDLARAVAGHTGEVVTADDGWLREHDIAFWAGPRSLPLWLPADMPGFATRSTEAFRAAGGDTRPLEATMRRVLDDERRRGLDRERRSGLSRPDELALIASL